jgi:hypothetical protein
MDVKPAKPKEHIYNKGEKSMSGFIKQTNCKETQESLQF